MGKRLDKIEAYLRRCRELSAFCYENGWIDNDTLRWEVVKRTTAGLEVSATFDEITTQGGGCVARHIERFGRLHLQLNSAGEVIAGQPY
ncbi:hypothetical protein [Nitrococcus mobilis]|uniref:Uncharacterized protein n=1 Tax=Nitrococcus mobilis Nb-231 TaxID=314278 RepID=A4BTF0_9GAMM|nr:hypothetical protein [Nitrococcus mobilis]EAR21052.1 hypothetical protein NB231_07777 [Nitrococcus mobilis Nb-231]